MDDFLKLAIAVIKIIGPKISQMRKDGLITIEDQVELDRAVADIGNRMSNPETLPDHWKKEPDPE